jgi:hypothetical protein
MITVGTFTALLLSFLPPFVATFHYTDGHRPALLSLAVFDKVFRGYGALLPLVPFSLRYLAYMLFPKPLQELSVTRHPVKDLILHVLTQLARGLLHLVHVLGQMTHLWHFATGDHSNHLFADHVLLGTAVQASLVMEVASACHFMHGLRVSGQRTGEAKSSRSMVLLSTSLCCSWLLFVLTGAEMYNTGRYFHPPREVCVALGIGLHLFLAPAAVVLYRGRRGSIHFV